MINNSDDSIKPEVVHKIIIEKNTSNAFGIASFIFGIISIFFLAPIFVPLALLFGIIAVIKKQLAWGVMGIICSIIGFITSPILLGLFGLMTIASSIDKGSVNRIPHNNVPIIQESSSANSNNQTAEQHQIYKKTEELIQFQEPIESTSINSNLSNENIFVKPSFDCSKADTLVEKTICSDELLANLDNDMVNSYKKAISLSKKTETIKKEQREWLNNKRNKCLNSECLKLEYNQRILHLKEYLTSLPEIQCNNLQYGSEIYHQTMEKLAKLAKLPDNYYSKYHEGVVAGLCNNNNNEVDDLVDNGYVKVEEVKSIAKILNINYTEKKRSEIGESYGYSKEKFLNMGLCSACSDNVAQYYTKEPSSRCGKLAKKALEGNPDAVKELQEFPEYCTWQY